MDLLPLVLAFTVGAAIGSFLNVCVARWPAGESVVSPRSRCPGCGHQIRWHENVPVLGWLLLRGRCASCGGRISAQYPAVELLVGLGWLAAVMAFGPTFTALRVAVFGTVMAGIALTDAKHYLIPDGFTVFGLLWVLLTAVGGIFVEGASPFAGPADAVLGACVGAGAISIIGWLGEVALRKEAMGFGDVTLMAVVGAALGPWRSLLTVFVGAALAAVVFLLVVIPVVKLRARRAAPSTGAAAGAAGGVATAEGDDEAGELPQVPFGVFLAPAALLTLLWGTELLDWYMGQFTV
ncbi:MAG TPA: prepilin peptidase [Gemmatimonadaceae bacterium]|nr:prepilin peptidase [Gemmatimonadaceae bacterium]